MSEVTENNRPDMEEGLRPTENEGNKMNEDNKGKGGRSVLMDWVKDIVVAVVIALIIVQFIKPTIVKESSMEPNFYENDYLFIYKMAYRGDKEPAKGDVVVFRSELKTETGKKKLLIKRVIGLPGDHITISDGKVMINGKEDVETYLPDSYTEGDVDATVPDNSLFCMGDNRDVSIDSRSEEVGFVSEDLLVGKVVLRLFPLNKMGRIKNPYNE